MPLNKLALIETVGTTPDIQTVAEAAAEQYPPVPLADAESIGWCGPDNPLEPATPEECMRDGILVMCVLIKQRKVPSKTRDAMVKNLLKKEGKASRHRKQEIRQQVTEQLLQKVEPDHKTITVMWAGGNTEVFTDATSENDMDLVAGMLQQILNVGTVGITSNVIRMRADKNKTLPPEQNNFYGREFLTWLVTKSYLDEAEDYLISDPVTLKSVVEDDDFTEVVKFDKGSPLTADSFRQALRENRLVSDCRITAVIEDSTYSFLISEDFILSRYKPSLNRKKYEDGYYEDFYFTCECTWKWIREKLQAYDEAYKDGRPADVQQFIGGD